MAEDLLKRYLRIIHEAGAPGVEHERLKRELRAWAIAEGFDTEYDRLPSGSIPDVLRGQKAGPFLFCGDAKDSANETIENSETLKRIGGYFDEFASLLGDDGGFKGGILAIATNSEEEADNWVGALNVLAKRAGMTGNGKPPSFRVSETKPGETWVIWW